MRVTYLSFVMTILWFSLAVWLGCMILLKSKKYRVELIGMLFLFALLRLFLPLSPREGLIIPSETIYPAIMNWIRTPLIGQNTVGELLLFLWAIVALGRLIWLMLRLIGQNRFWLHIPNLAAESELQKTARAVGQAIGCGVNIELTVSPTLAAPLQVGFLHPRILLPHNVEAFSEKAVDSILRHEICHFLGGDLWIKLSVQILGCVLWWNPVMPFLSRSVEQLLELRCDQRACRDLAEEDRLSYVNTLLQIIQNTPSEKRKISVSFLGSSEDIRIVQRFQLLLSGKPAPASKAKLLATFAICIALFVASYYVELQPHTAPPIESIEGGVTISPETSYILHTVDGNFDLYYEGIYITTLPEEALLTRPHCDLTIYEGDVPK